MNIYSKITPELKNEVADILTNKVILKRNLKQSVFWEYFKEISIHFNIKNARQILYLALHQTEPTCLTCGGKVKWKEYRYRRFCSNRKCSTTHPDVIQKTKQTNINKYGTENPQQHDSVREKTKTTMVERYGVVSPLQSTEIRQKYKNTLKEKYGEDVNSSFSLKEVRGKSTQTNIEKYGVEYPSQRDNHFEKVCKNSMERHGVMWPCHTEQATRKRKDTVIEKYGVEFIGSAGEVKAKRKSTVLEKYGVENVKKIGQSQQTLEFLSNKELFTKLVSEKSMEELAKIYDISPYPIYSRMKELGLTPVRNQTSLFEKEILEYIKTIYDGTIIENDRTIIHPKELDIYLPELQLAIECNGLYWHSVESGKDKDYHFTKTNSCDDKNIDLVYIWDYQWDKDQSTIKHNLKELIDQTYLIEKEYSSIQMTVARSSDIWLERNLRHNSYLKESVSSPEPENIKGFTVYNSGIVTYCKN
jgi:hypothetical protein